MTSLAAVTGRFQPFHVEHLELVQRALGEFDRVVIGVTNPDSRSLQAHPNSAHRHKPEANPYTYWQRYRMITAALGECGLVDRVEVVPFPLDEPSVWAQYIPLHAVQYVRVYTPWERSKVERLRDGGYEVRDVQPRSSKPLRASDIRASLAGDNDAAWQMLVPGSIVGMLEPVLPDSGRSAG